MRISAAFAAAMSRTVAERPDTRRAILAGRVSVEPRPATIDVSKTRSGLSGKCNSLAALVIVAVACSSTATRVRSAPILPMRLNQKD